MLKVSSFVLYDVFVTCAGVDVFVTCAGVDVFVTCVGVDVCLSLYVLSCGEVQGCVTSVSMRAHVYVFHPVCMVSKV